MAGELGRRQTSPASSAVITPSSAYCPLAKAFSNLIIGSIFLTLLNFSLGMKISIDSDSSSLSILVASKQLIICFLFNLLKGKLQISIVTPAFSTVVIIFSEASIFSFVNPNSSANFLSFLAISLASSNILLFNSSGFTSFNSPNTLSLYD